MSIELRIYTKVDTSLEQKIDIKPGSYRGVLIVEEGYAQAFIDGHCEPDNSSGKVVIFLLKPRILAPEEQQNFKLINQTILDKKTYEVSSGEHTQFPLSQNIDAVLTHIPDDPTPFPEIFRF